MAEVRLGLGDGLVMLGSGELGLGQFGLGEFGLGQPGLGEPGSGEPGSGEPKLGDSELGNGEAEVALGRGDTLGKCGAALRVSGPQPASTTMVADTEIAGNIRFGFTSKLLYLLEHQLRAPTRRVWLKCEMFPLGMPAVTAGHRAAGNGRSSQSVFTRSEASSGAAPSLADWGGELVKVERPWPSR